MTQARRCSKSACNEEAVATFTYDYADQMVVIGPLARHHEPNAYDLCQSHADRLNPPQNWQIVRLCTRFDEPPLSVNDPEALIKAMKEEGTSEEAGSPIAEQTHEQEPSQPVHEPFQAEIISLPMPHQRNVEAAPSHESEPGSEGSDQHEEAAAPKAGMKTVEYGPFSQPENDLA